MRLEEDRGNSPAHKHFNPEISHVLRLVLPGFPIQALTFAVRRPAPLDEIQWHKPDQDYPYGIDLRLIGAYQSTPPRIRIVNWLLLDAPKLKPTNPFPRTRCIAGPLPARDRPRK